jgi:hypothetical protein
MNLPQDTINKTQMSSKFSTILDYTSSSGLRFQLTVINNDSLGKTCAFLDTTMLLPTNDCLKKVLEESVSESYAGIESINVVAKYRLYIVKGTCFDWEKIAMQVIEFLETVNHHSLSRFRNNNK